MTPEAAADSLWNWSLKVYQQDDVQELLLTLQNRYQVNVNLIIWSAWAARKGWEYSPDQVEYLSSALQDFDELVVDRLREIRRYLEVPHDGYSSSDMGKLRCEVLDLELKAEKVVQRRLASLAMEIAPEQRSLEVEEAEEIAVNHFLHLGSSLENPLRLADSVRSKTPTVLFRRFLDLSATEKPA